MLQASYTCGGLDMQTDDERLSVRPGDAARLTGLSERYVRELIARGELYSVRVGTARLIPLEALRRLVSDDSER
jgi:excisionase family DNA binding protein